MQPVVEPAGWYEPDYYCWGGHVAVGPGEDGPETVHFYGTRWPRWSGFLGWLWRSEICRATAPSLTGPFVTREVLLTTRTDRRPDGRCFWDQHSVFNSTVLHDGKVYLYYTGTQHAEAESFPDDDLPQTRMKMTEIRDGWARMHQRVGVVVGQSPTGPWQRMDEPLLVPGNDPWAQPFNCNPTICRHPDGRCFLYYKTVDASTRALAFAVAIADCPTGPFVPYENNPILNPGLAAPIEDHHVWYEDGAFHMLFKDMNGTLSGVPSGTAIIHSNDGLSWDFRSAVLAYRPGWPTATGRQLAHRMEQTNLYLENGRPRAMYCAVLNADERADPLHPFHRRVMATYGEIELRSRNIAIMLDA